MRQILLAAVALSLVPALAFAAGKTSKKPAAGGISDATVSAAVTEFVDALNSLEDERVLKAVAPADRGALQGRDNLIGLVFAKKLGSPSVVSWEKVESGGRTLGVLAKVKVDETDPLDAVKTSKERTWFLALDGKDLRVSVASVWLDADMVREP